MMKHIRVIDLQGNAHDVQGEVGRPLMESLRNHDFGVAALCGGMCSCATCHVYVNADWFQRLPPRQGDEQFLLDELSVYRPEQSRLSCQLTFTEQLDGIEVEIAPEE